MFMMQASAMRIDRPAKLEAVGKAQTL